MVICTIDLAYFKAKVNHTLNRSMTPEKSMGRNDVICLNAMVNKTALSYFFSVYLKLLQKLIFGII